MRPLLWPPLALLLALPAQAAPVPPQPAPEATPAPSLYPSPNERIGVGLVYAIADITNYNVTQLQAGFYSEWGTRMSAPHPNGMDYLPLIPVSELAHYPPNWDHILASHQPATPAQLWLVGNEPEGFCQENHTPAEYAADLPRRVHVPQVGGPDGAGGHRRRDPAVAAAPAVAGRGAERVPGALWRADAR